MNWYARNIERRIEEEKARKRDDAAFLLWLIFEYRDHRQGGGDLMPRLNAHARTYLTETPLTVKRALDEAVQTHGCDDSISLRIATEAVASGRAAYWTRYSRHNAPASIMLNNLNRGASFEDAIAELYPPHRHWQIEGGLKTLVPLNRAAANALAKAYVQFTGTWFEDEELLARRFASARKREAV